MFQSIDLSKMAVLMTNPDQPNAASTFPICDCNIQTHSSSQQNQEWQLIG